LLQLITGTMAAWVIPVFLFTALVYAFVKRIDVFDTFVEGAQDGFSTSIKLIPFLVGMLAAIGVLRASGALDIFIAAVTPLLTRLNIPGDVVPLAIMRPISGSAALGITAEILQSRGPDSMLGRIASTMQGSTDTTLFVLTVYFGSVGIRRTRHALAAGLLADLAGFLAAITVCNMVFG
jgi:spore maturation protein B